MLVYTQCWYQNSFLKSAKMASEEHHNLATFIKSVHQDLRSQSRKFGPQEAWKLHCEQGDTLHKYASAMKLLATKYWDPNAEDITKQAQSRIQWVVEHCIKYFIDDFMAEGRKKEENKWSKLMSTALESVGSSVIQTASSTYWEPMRRLRLLDVGSCYNPFKQFDIFDVLPIDIAPASTDVYKCDFLNVSVCPPLSSEIDFSSKTWASRSVTELQECMFDAIVFSLLLEYLPSTQQRYSACLKAYKLLKPEGLLFIITPDSKHPSANAPLMKKWRTALANMGFIRIFYEKLPHIHCMAFRKSLHPDLAKHLAHCLAGVEQLNSPEQLMGIPQDGNDIINENQEDSQASEYRTEDDNLTVMEFFAELPN